jgi:hypothetical protein
MLLSVTISCRWTCLGPTDSSCSTLRSRLAQMTGSVRYRRVHPRLTVRGRLGRAVIQILLIRTAQGPEFDQRMATTSREQRNVGRRAHATVFQAACCEVGKLRNSSPSSLLDPQIFSTAAWRSHWMSRPCRQCNATRWWNDKGDERRRSMPSGVVQYRYCRHSVQ